ncbi:ABC transporter ATP-binding protein [Halobacteriales archaeon SW_7_71_33]|nr:MAG: ABC transporter ATP-binding protein [Halobacteriales archaeon SW_7_71_33]
MSGDDSRDPRDPEPDGGTATAVDTDVDADADGDVPDPADRTEPYPHGWARPSAAEGEVALSLSGVTKRFGATPAAEDLSLSVYEGELLTVVGPSGCGKTTTLRLIAGLERPDAGTVRVGGEVVAGDGGFVPAEERDVGVVFQEFALFPHMTTAENVGFGLDDRPRAERERRVEELLDLVGLSAERDAYPDELSGGQQQRVALARSLAPEPDVLLLDEPFANLDVDLRERMREEVRAILREAGVTAVSVTHDQEEALSIGDRVAVMHDGGLEQVGRPERVFQHPESRFVAGFLGHASFVPGSVTGEAVETAVGGVSVDRVYGLGPEYEWSTVDLLVRPDDLAARPAPEGDADGRVVGRQFLGATVKYRVELDDDGVVECAHNHTEHIERGAPVSVDFVADHDLAWFPRSRPGADGGDSPAVDGARPEHGGHDAG